MEMKSRRTDHDTNWRDDDSVSVPDSWSIASLGMIAKNLDGRRVPIKSKDRSNRQGQYPYYGASGIIDTIDEFLFDGDFLLIAEDGANLLSRSTPIAFRASGRFWVNNHAHVVQTLGGMPLDYLQAYLNGTNLEHFITGSAQPKLTQESMNSIPVPIAPLAEQLRIVKKIGTLLGQVNRVRNHLSRVPTLLKRFRQAVLAAACSGSLTEDWRNSAEQSQLPQDNLRGPAAVPSANGDGDTPELPYSWLWKTVGQIASPQERSIQSGPFGSHLLHSEFQESGVLAIGIDNVLEGEFSLGKQHRIGKAKYETLKQFTARPNDVLITVMATVGRCCVIPEDIEPAIVTKHVYRITVNRSVCEPHFLMFALRGDIHVRRQIESQIRGQTRPGINGQILRCLSIPTPPLVEQREIKRRVQAMLLLADRIEQRLSTATSQANKLTQSILAKAFRGELVPTEAELARREGREYEPASVLLERITKEREPQTSTKPERKRIPPRAKLATTKG
jgi:type I restriction enzyme S subunit